MLNFKFKTSAVAIGVLIILSSLTSCQGAAGSVFKNLPIAVENTPASQQQAGSNASVSSQTGNVEETTQNLESNQDYGSLSASLFDYTAIKIDTTKSLDTEIRNCDIYLDIYGDLMILGEIKNSSLSYKTNLEITFDFYNSKGEILDTQRVKTIADYILPGKSFPFSLIYDKRSNYIDITKVKIGVNYKNYNKSFAGFPVVSRKNFYYIDDMMIINGNISNIGSSGIEDLKLIGIFYNYKNKVVFLKECYLLTDKLLAGQNEDFALKILLDEYTPEFTHFKFEASFRDTLKV